VSVFLLLSLALGIAQLESILRVTREPVRYQLKFVLIGLGALAGYQIYQDSQFLLLPAWRADFVSVGGLATLISVGLVAFGLGRTRLQAVALRVHVSPQMLYGSLTFVVVGLYLLAVGLIGQMIRLSGQVFSVGLSTLLVFVAAIGLVVGLSSRTARAELKKFISHHFYRSNYDYRAKWREVTEAFRICSSVDSILDQLLDLLSRTFGAGRISIWLRYEADGRFHQVRSANTEPAPPPLDCSHPVVARLQASDQPVNVEQPRRGDAEERTLDGFLEATQAVLCIPIRCDGELASFVALSRELHGDRYAADDCDLLRAISHHVGVLFSHARLAEERRGAAELEALHRFS
ncbi:MAG: GAF domain-containing protein, partial [Anaerolineales bacterium]